ncbi:MAG: VWA domain-containing protein [Planctomycetota bacterium]
MAATALDPACCTDVRYDACVFSARGSGVIADSLGSVRFLIDWPIWGLWLLAILGGIVTLVLYSRESRTLSAPYAYALPALRGAAVTLLIFLIFGPIWHRQRVDGSPGRVVFMVDTSASMAETDVSTIDQWTDEAAPTRLERAVSRLQSDPQTQSPGWIDRLSETHYVDVIEFDQGTRLRATTRIDNDDADSDWNRMDFSVVPRSLTDLRLAVQTGSALSVAESDSATAASTLVLMSDGRDTTKQSGASLIDAASELSRRGWTIHAIGIGQMEEPADVAVLDVQAPERVADDGRLAGELLIKHYGHVGQTARIEISHDAETVWSDNFKITSDGLQRLPFDFPVKALMTSADSSTPVPSRRGLNRDTIVLELTATISLQSETSDPQTRMSPLQRGDFENDRLDFRVAAASRDRRLLILDGTPRWEVRYLRNLFSRDPAWQVETVLFGPGTDRQHVRRGDQPGQIPANAADWAAYDAVIFGEVFPDHWSADDAAGLRDFVARGGGLIFIDGLYEHLARLATRNAIDDDRADSRLAAVTPMKELSVVEYLDGLGNRVGSLGGASDVTLRSVANRPRVQSILPTQMGATHPVLRIAPGGDASQFDQVSSSLWERLPPPRSTPRIRAAPGAEVWAESITTDNQRVPWLVTRPFGGGRVFYLATDETWRWRYKIESRLHGRFWNQLLTAAMPSPYAVQDDFVAIGTDKVDYQVGDEPIIAARLLQWPTAKSTPTDAPIVDALLTKNGEVVAVVPLQVDDLDRGTFTAAAPQLAPGQYDVSIRASGYDASALSATTPIWVVDRQTDEHQQVSVDESTLSAIASAGGGLYVDEASCERIIEEILPTSRGRIVTSDTPMYPSPWAFAIVLGLLSIEWLCRKQVGLI